MHSRKATLERGRLFAWSHGEGEGACGEACRPPPLQKKACYLRVPFHAKAGTELQVSFYVCGDKGPGATIFIRVGEERTRLANVDIKSQWREVCAAHTFTKDSNGTVELIAPSSYGGKPGRAWEKNKDSLSTKWRP